jgi:hypothetical protein
MKEISPLGKPVALCGKPTAFPHFFRSAAISRNDGVKESCLRARKTRDRARESLVGAVEKSLGATENFHGVIKHRDELRIKSDGARNIFDGVMNKYDGASSLIPMTRRHPPTQP